jgi:hypothetical protein
VQVLPTPRQTAQTSAATSRLRGQTGDGQFRLQPVHGTGEFFSTLLVTAGGRIGIC